MSTQAFGEDKIKYPNVSGQFYPNNPQQLSTQLDQFFSQADIVPSKKNVSIVIAPHAGYVYSGGVAAYGFKAASHGKYKTIVILAPSHHVGFDGISVWDSGEFSTPLGNVKVDDVFTQQLMDSNDKIYFKSEAFEREHALEVEIPFLQKTFKDFVIVPVVMGQPSARTLKKFAQRLAGIIGARDDVLIVVSTDLSHYHDGAFARNMDLQTLDAIKGMDIETIIREHENKKMEMCGFIPVVTALLYAKEQRLGDVEILKYAHSGDVSGENDRVVGYAAIVIYDGAARDKSSNEVPMLSKEQKRRLLTIAKTTMEEYVRTGKTLNVSVSDPRLNLEEGAFVTIHKHGRLRGCIGNVIGRGPLYLTVRNMAVAAVSQDPRFPPVKNEELSDLDLEVSVLSKPRRITNVDEIILGVHGVIISSGIFKQGLFLPQVATETGWTKEEFLSQLCTQKAHLPANAWKDPKTKIEIFTADVFSTYRKL